MKIYGDIQSGNCYKVKLVCALLDINYDWIEVDILAGETKKPEFLKKNPNGKIPLSSKTELIVYFKIKF